MADAKSFGQLYLRAGQRAGTTVIASEACHGGHLSGQAVIPLSAVSGGDWPRVGWLAPAPPAGPGICAGLVIFTRDPDVAHKALSAH